MTNLFCLKITPCQLKDENKMFVNKGRNFITLKTYVKILRNDRYESKDFAASFNEKYF
jgi:hypothetical protein